MKRIISSIENHFRIVIIVLFILTMLIAFLICYGLSPINQTVLLVIHFIYLSLCVFLSIHKHVSNKDQTVLRITSRMFLYFGLCAFLICILCVKSAIDDLAKEGSKEVMTVLSENRVIPAAIVAAGLLIVSLVLFLIRRVCKRVF